MMTLHWRDIERAASVHLGLIQLGLGLCLIIGGPARFPPPTYAALLDATNGQSWPYGAAVLLLAVPLLWPRERANYWGHWLGVVVMNGIAALFFLSMVRDPNASAIAWWVFFAFGTVHGFNIAIHLVRKRQGMYEPADNGGERNGGA